MTGDIIVNNYLGDGPDSGERRRIKKEKYRKKAELAERRVAASEEANRIASQGNWMRLVGQVAQLVIPFIGGFLGALLGSCPNVGG